MKVLVTGASGLIGSHLSGELTARGHDVWAVTRTVASGRAQPGVHRVPLDLTAQSWVQLPPRADVVVHLAQSPHYRSFPEGALDVFDVNVASTARLLDWARKAGVRQFILASSGGVPAAMGQRTSHYVASKRCAELLAESYGALFDVLTLRFFFVYGRGQKPWMLVPRLLQTIQSDGEVMLAGPHGPRLNPVHVADAVQAIVRAIDGGESGTIDIAGPEVLTVRAMSDTIAARLGRTARYACDLDAEPHDLLGDISEMSARLWQPQHKFVEGVAELIPVAEEKTD